jgi:hypothetical protein
LVNKLLKLLQKLKVPNGLSVTLFVYLDTSFKQKLINKTKQTKAVGYSEKDIQELVKGTLPQRRVLNLSPKPVDVPELTILFKNSMKLY